MYLHFQLYNLTGIYTESNDELHRLYLINKNQVILNFKKNQWESSQDKKTGSYLGASFQVGPPCWSYLSYPFVGGLLRRQNILTRVLLHSAHLSISPNCLLSIGSLLLLLPCWLSGECHWKDCPWPSPEAQSLTGRCPYSYQSMGDDGKPLQLKSTPFLAGSVYLSWLHLKTSWPAFSPGPGLKKLFVRFSLSSLCPGPKFV